MNEHEFVPIKDYPLYEINRLGVVRNIKTGKHKKPILRTIPGSNVRYYDVDLWKDGNVVRTGTHRILALTFMDPDPDPSKTLVNHVDGNGLNNTLSNLEWCNHSGNIDHAYETGLRSDNVKIKLLNAKTMRWGIFRSWHKAADAIGVSASALHYAYQAKPDNLYKGYLIRLVDDPRPIPEALENPSRKGVAVIRTDLDTGKSRTFNSVTAACYDVPYIAANVRRGLLLKNHYKSGLLEFVRAQ